MPSPETPAEQTAVSSRDEPSTLPDPYVERVRREGGVLDLTLNDSIRLALTNNLEIAIEDYNEELNREQIVATEGFYDPIVGFSIGWESSESPTTSIIQAGQGVATFERRGLTFGTTVQQPVLGGGDFFLTWSNNRNSSNSAFSFVNPSYGSIFDLRFVQPLWRGFMETQTERQLKLLNLDTEISDSQFQQRVSEIVQRVENQYWELVFAIENYETQRGAMQLAIIQYENSQKRVEIGVQAPIEITTTRAEVARNEQTMIQSEVNIVQAENALKQLLAPDPRASIWNLNLIPTDRPEVQEVQITMAQAIETALARRPELEQIRLQIEKQEVNRDFLDRQGKPQVNLEFNFGSVGQAGLVRQRELIDTDGDGIPETPGDAQVPDPSHPLFGNFGRSLTQAFGFDFLNYGAAVNVQWNFRNRTNEAELAQVAIQERQFLGQMKNEQQAIMVDVRNAFEGIQIQKKRLEAASLQRELSEEKLEGENKRFEAGLSTNFQVLQSQRDLSEAQVAELRTLIDYQLALTALEKATYTIIDSNDIVLARSQNGD
ncbi:MAG: TolC family protein [Acidobacteriota bacterium]